MTLVRFQRIKRYKKNKMIKINVSQNLTKLRNNIRGYTKMLNHPFIQESSAK